MEEHRRRQVAFVLGSSEQRFLKHIDAVDRDGSFISHCSFYIPASEPTTRMRERAEALHAAWRHACVVDQFIDRYHAEGGGDPAEAESEPLEREKGSRNEG